MKKTSEPLITLITLMTLIKHFLILICGICLICDICGSDIGFLPSDIYLFPFRA